MAVYYALGPVLSARLQATMTGTDFRNAFASHRRLAISMLVGGALLALAWRTAWLEPAALKVADGALVTVAGIFVGFVFGGRASRVLAPGAPVPVRPLVAAGAALIISEFTHKLLKGELKVKGLWLHPVKLARLNKLLTVL